MSPTRLIREHNKLIATILLSTFGFQLSIPFSSFALTSGPSQPEFADFEQASTTEMVDPFTGNFSYNIPLFELPGPNGGYPFNLSYHAGITPEQEASWVGLGWSLNAGAITRQVRGLPDEFNGDEISTTKEMESNNTVGVCAGVGIEVFGADPLQTELGLTARYNTYNGFGYSLDGGFGFPFATASGKTSAELGLNFSLDENQGLNVSPSLSISNQDLHSFTNINKFSLGAGYNSRFGMTDISLGLSTQRRENIQLGNKNVLAPLGNNYSASLSLANHGFTPVVNTPISNRSWAFKIKGGAAWWGAFPNAYAKGFYNTQKLRDKDFSIKAFGYKNLQNAGDEDLLDFNRERDGLIHKESPNLALPVLIHDIYKIQGQGIGSMFRPLRTDIGTVYDNRSTSKSTSTSLGAEVGPVVAHAGVNLGLLLADNTSGKWNYTGSAARNFEQFDKAHYYEPWYFKVYGEHTSNTLTSYNNIGGDKAVNLNFTGSAKNPSVNWSLPARDQNMERPLRAGTVVEITNDKLWDASRREDVYPLFNVGLDRSSHKPHHPAGYICTNQDGLRYVYALPVYNFEKTEVVYGDKSLNTTASIIEFDPAKRPHTFKHYTKTTTPAYAHSYLLTAVVGPDYVDITNDGVTDDDLGYWVKFSYTKSTGEYNWKTPYDGAFFHEGTYAEQKHDNRATFEYGCKEQYYLEKAETKTHAATFNTTSDRKDNLGADFSQFMPEETPAKASIKSRRLRNVTLETKSGGETNSVLSVHFDNDHYLLCKGTKNGDPTVDKGKLTLKGLHFNYSESTKRLNRYEFDYKEDPVKHNQAKHNADYSVDSQDRWGFYKLDDPNNKDFPYVDQFAEKSDLDDFAGMWSLKGIKLPSGGVIEVDYEMDTYAYVQHKRAMKMARLLNDDLSSGFVRKEIRFQKEANESLNYGEYRAALEGEDIYFKARVNNLNENDGELVSGYFSIDGADDFDGFIANGYHPISERAWEHMRTNAPKLLSNTGESKGKDIDPADLLPIIKLLGTAANEIKQIFKGFKGYASGKGWANSIATKDNSLQAWIRVPVLNGVKYGGGHRVKRILIKESKNADGENTYGQIYDYSMKDEQGNTISSGVAANEPIIGGEESPLRKPKNFTQKIPLHSNNNLFYEYPINEGSHPGASVGYRKVTVMSLAAAERYAAFDPTFQLDEDILPNDVEFGTSGKTVYEFYTAKDFPTITDETIKQEKAPDKSWSVSPFIGINTSSYYTAAQGYSIINNDMHGKLKKLSQYRQRSDGSFEGAPFSYSKYTYKSKRMVYQGERVSRLDNIFQNESSEFAQFMSKGHLVKTPSGGDADLMQLGVEAEMVLDARKYSDKAFSGGFNANLELLSFFFGVIPIPVSWPNISESITEVKTIVNNKIIHKAGILQKVETLQDGAKVATEYLRWDRLTGRPVLQEVTTQFNKHPVYYLTTPGYTQYSRMGPAYINQGFTFEFSNIYEFPGKNEFEADLEQPADGSNLILIAGDEVIIREITTDADGTESFEPKGSAIYVGKYSGTYRFSYKDRLDDTRARRYEGTVVRSGNRNHLSLDIGSLSSLRNPLNFTDFDGRSLTETVVVPR
ncbi:MAG: hypothetical protein AAF616_13355 [Bacteroidota bacterium]